MFDLPALDTKQPQETDRDFILMENYMAVISSMTYPVVSNDTQRVITEDYLECPDSDSTFLCFKLCCISDGTVLNNTEIYQVLKYW